MSIVWFRAVMVGALVLAGCTERESGDADLSGALSVADSTGDTIVVTVSGDPAPERLRHLVPELSIASSADDPRAGRRRSRLGNRA